MQVGKGIISMWINHVILGILGVIAGSAVAAGTFAFITVIGVLPRLIGKWNFSAKAIYFENVVALGGTVGCILSVFLQIQLYTDMMIQGKNILGSIFLIIFGLCAGMFVGCCAVALAEILNTFPIIFRRFHLKEGLSWVILSVALGKMFGSLYYFFFGLTNG